MKTLLSVTWQVDPTIFTLFGREIRWYGLLWVIGLIVAVYIVQRIFKNEKLPEKWFDSLFGYMMLGIILGARLGHCLFYEPQYYLANPLEIVKIWEGGLASHGGVIGIIIAVWLYSRRVTRKSMLWTFDRVMVPTGFTAAMIRFGNLMNHEIYGGPTNLPWGFRFIDNVGLWMRGAEPIYTEPSHPTQIYEALFYLVVFAITMHMYWKTNARERQGLILGVGIALIFIARFFIEFVKNVQVDSEEAMRENTGLILGQWLSIPFIVWGIWLIWQALRRKPEPVTQKKSLDYNQNVKPKK
ncbi:MULTISPECIES: prolipoprotein diacylglyceryl transferase [Petrimonas]|jgi:phosphatidylglycerol:prolipoprotein diacylglycerol transferase|uniref:Phosphatidylglycerol--prolipoprotein diacylglyceryl transferase n=1 Tax=Petrimonas mucosa TaxID=1642646 RepID=A0A1G4G6L7_9BACT|nr:MULTISPECIES: prolipoprotein diacylglyceryl transferase [Petrimonas]MDD3560174.1 prolipoprotein diacylglyceryl transferase [Petrimonas mucosa]SCM57445.1 Prolipoprotein diacylglyceryl transferase {ECO:0000255/HAMAP-Rule:MF_01147} [Petrimonas mucosa]SFU33209.1 prolipoprotein diacylglyceryl transferase [Porphyromonadaceae bacterium KHP3R9]HHT29156.1 prolipoprotein diacylglyceryl transferase [Petrimonas mucosa]